MFPFLAFVSIPDFFPTLWAAQKSEILGVCRRMFDLYLSKLFIFSKSRNFMLFGVLVA